MENEKRLVGLNEFMKYTGLGKNRAAEFGEKIGCRVRVGRRVLYDLRKADKEIDKLAEKSI